MAIRTQRIRWSRRQLLAIAAGTGVMVGGVLLLGSAVSRSTSASGGQSRSAVAAVDPQGARDPRASAEHGAGPRPAALPDSHVDPAAVRKTALEYSKGRFNAFFDEKAFLASSVAEGRLSIKALRDQLLNIEELKALPRDVHVLTGKPAAVVERMAMIDTLEAMSEVDASALDALVEVGSKPLERELAVQTKRAVAAEKYDVFVALARKNWELAKKTFLDLHNPALMDLLKPALIGGLVDSGLSRTDAVRTVDALATPPASQDG
jgi:hypothetical protein